MNRSFRRASRLCGAASIGAFAAISGINTSAVHADVVVRNGNYHAQTTSYFCAAASVEMMLDVPGVTGGNAVVTNMLGVGDGTTVAIGAPTPTAGLDGMGNVTSRAQSFIYGVMHGTNTVNGVTYSNPLLPVGTGSDSLGIVTSLNLLDNPLVNGNTGPAFGTHVYNTFNTAPNIIGATLASRTLANALTQYAVPAQAAVENGAHSICVYGVATTGTAAPGANYTINGFFIHDPWTGYVYDRLTNHADAAPLAAGGWGLGWNTYLRYGFDTFTAGGAPTQLPNGNVVNARLGAWFNYFNPSGGQPNTGQLLGVPGYKFTVEPQGPESLESYDGVNGSLPEIDLTGSPTDLSTGTLDTDATGDLSAFTSDPGLSGGDGLDFTNDMMIQMPGDTSGEGDWLVPYDGSGGTNDVTGALMIDANTGVVDEATWIDPTTDGGISNITLDQLDQMFQDQSASGLLQPNDNNVSVPEPASLTLVGMAAAALLLRRNRSIV